MPAEGAESTPLPPFLAHQVILSTRSLCGTETSLPKTLCPELMGRYCSLSKTPGLGGVGLGLGPPLGAGVPQAGWAPASLHVPR